MKTIARRRIKHLHAYCMLGHKKAERRASTIGSFSPPAPWGVHYCCPYFRSEEIAAWKGWVAQALGGGAEIALAPEPDY